MNRLYNFAYKNIVMMDDELCLLMVYERLLEDYPLNIFTYTDADEAMKCVWKLNGDVALFTTDYQHVGIQVCDMAKRIKNAYPHIRFVVISGYGGRVPELIKEGLVDELLYKSFDTKEYVDLIERHCGLKDDFRLSKRDDENENK